MNPKRFQRQILVLASILLAAPAAAADFPTVVRAILDHQSEGPLTEMDGATRKKMTDCVVTTLDALPSGLKRKITEGRTLEDQEHAFGQVVDAEHAKWRQTIAKQCGHIAVDN